MGCPDGFYKKVLQYFAYNLVYSKDVKLASKLAEENSITKLEKFILEKKETANKINFYFSAGCAYGAILIEAGEEGCDAINACAGGLQRFVDLIGLNQN